MRCHVAAFTVALGIGTSLFFQQVVAAAVFFGPTPYLNFINDSPLIVGNYHYRENETFEDGFLSSAGVFASGGVVLLPGSQTDSVDKDTGSQVIDGSGINGRSFHANGATSLSFTFIAANLPGGVLPTHAGIVWTDVGTVTSGQFGMGNVFFEAFGPGNAPLGAIGPVLLGDGLITGQTAEDRFFGVFNANGVSRITISMPDSTDWEIDNLQFALVMVPEPAAISLAGIALAGCALILRQHRRG